MRCIKLIVEWGDVSPQKQDFYFCLDCKKVLTRSGFFDHRVTFMMTEDEAERRFNQWTNNMARLEWR